MSIENLLPITTIALAVACFAGTAAEADPDKNISNRGASVNFKQIRNATIKVEYAGTVFLIDPMLGDKGAYPGFEGTVNSHLRNPLVELPMDLSDVIKADAVIVTHTHLDH